MSPLLHRCRRGLLWSRFVPVAGITAGQTVRLGLLAILAALAPIGVRTAGAAVSGTMQVEGVLLAASGGAAVDGPYKLTFKLWDADKGGNELWSETVDAMVVGGRFDATIGASTAIDPGKLANGKVWLGLSVGADPELQRRPLASVAFALRAGIAEGVACSGCLTAGALAFNYAGSKTKGGPAADLACTACVGVAELSFDGDVDLGGNSLKAKNATFSGDVSAKSVTAVDFIGDGSKLTGIAHPTGNCKAGEAVVGIASDGSLLCKAFSAALPADGLDEVSNGLLTNQFLESVTLAKPLAIPDNTGASANAQIDVPDWGVAQGLTIKVKVANTDLSTLSLKLLPPDDKKVGYTLCDPCGDKDAKALDTAWSEKVAPKSGDLAAWVGSNAKGSWTVVATDTNFCVKQAPGNNELCDLDTMTDGAIEAFSIEVATLSNKTVGLNGNLSTAGDVTVGGTLTASKLQLPKSAKPPVACDASTLGFVYMDTELVALRLCNGSDWATIALVVWGTQANPAASCADLKAKNPAATSGSYWIDPDGSGSTAAYQVYCEQALEGGGWTRIVRLQGSQDKALAGVPNSQEYVDNGTWQFSKTQLKASNREVLIVEQVSPFRMHRYDFKQGTNPQGEDFVGTITGDRGATVAVWNWTKSAWQLMGNGSCNNNNHSQWNCEPPSGIRFHFATRDWTGNGGSSQNDGWTWFTGYNTGYGNLGELVKNWNGATNQTAHHIYVR